MSNHGSRQPRDRQYRGNGTHTGIRPTDLIRDETEEEVLQTNAHEIVGSRRADKHTTGPGMVPHNVHYQASQPNRLGPPHNAYGSHQISLNSKRKRDEEYDGRVTPPEAAFTGHGQPNLHALSMPMSKYRKTQARNLSSQPRTLFSHKSAVRRPPNLADTLNHPHNRQSSGSSVRTLNDSRYESSRHLHTPSKQPDTRFSSSLGLDPSLAELQDLESNILASFDEGILHTNQNQVAPFFSQQNYQDPPPPRIPQTSYYNAIDNRGRIGDLQSNYFPESIDWNAYERDIPNIGVDYAPQRLMPSNIRAPINTTQPSIHTHNWEDNGASNAQGAQSRTEIRLEGTTNDDLDRVRREQEIGATPQATKEGEHFANINTTSLTSDVRNQYISANLEEATDRDKDFEWLVGADVSALSILKATGGHIDSSKTTITGTRVNKIPKEAEHYRGLVAALTGDLPLSKPEQEPITPRPISPLGTPFTKYRTSFIQGIPNNDNFPSLEDANVNEEDPHGLHYDQVGLLSGADQTKTSTLNWGELFTLEDWLVPEFPSVEEEELNAVSVTEQEQRDEAAVSLVPLA